MSLELEVISRFQHAGDADALLYTPLKAGLTARHSRVYQARFTGDADALRAFLRRVLVDDISQEVSWGGRPVLSGWLFHLDYGMKPGALDLEKETVLDYYRGSGPHPFELESLSITQRVYVFGAGDADALSRRFVRDIVNPAIHRHAVVAA